MIPTIIYPALKNYAPLNALVNGRIYRDYAGDAPTAPYVVWMLLATVPSNHLSGIPGADRYSIAVDVFSTDRAQSDAMLVAARDAMEAIGRMTSGPQSLGRDSETKLFRYTFTVDVFKNR